MIFEVSSLSTFVMFFLLDSQVSSAAFGPSNLPSKVLPVLFYVETEEEETEEEEEEEAEYQAVISVQYSMEGDSFKKFRWHFCGIYVFRSAERCLIPSSEIAEATPKSARVSMRRKVIAPQ